MTTRLKPSLRADLVEQIDELAPRLATSRAKLIEQAIEQYLQRKGWREVRA